MANKDVKICVVQEKNKEGVKDNQKILIDLSCLDDEKVLDSIKKSLNTILEAENVNVIEGNVSTNDLIKNLMSSLDNTKAEVDDIEAKLGEAITTLAAAFKKEESDQSEIANSIYVAYLMMKDDISLDKIMKYADFSMPELEMIKYYLLEKNNF